jgi:hypothetical protein
MRQSEKRKKSYKKPSSNPNRTQKQTKYFIRPVNGSKQRKDSDSKEARQESRGILSRTSKSSCSDSSVR